MLIKANLLLYPAIVIFASFFCNSLFLRELGVFSAGIRYVLCGYMAYLGYPRRGLGFYMESSVRGKIRFLRLVIPQTNG